MSNETVKIERDRSSCRIYILHVKLLWFGLLDSILQVFSRVLRLIQANVGAI